MNEEEKTVYKKKQSDCCEINENQSRLKILQNVRGVWITLNRIKIKSHKTQTRLSTVDIQYPAASFNHFIVHDVYTLCDFEMCQVQLANAFKMLGYFQCKITSNMFVMCAVYCWMWFGHFPTQINRRDASDDWTILILKTSCRPCFSCVFVFTPTGTVQFRIDLLNLFGYLSFNTCTC